MSFWVYQRLGAGLLLVLPLVLVLYPDGRLPVGRWRALALVGLVATSLLPLTLVAAPADVAQPASGAGALPAAFGSLDLDMVTLPLPDAAWSVLLRVSYLALALSLLAPFAVVVREYRLATGLRRTRMRWLLWAAVVDVLLMLTIRLLPGNVGSVGLVVAVVVTAGSVAVGITRPDLVDVDRLLGGTLLYGALLVAAFVLDLLILGAAGRLLGGRLSDDQALVLAVFLVTAVYAPLRHRVWRAVRRWVLGERDDPYRVVAALAERLEDSPPPTCSCSRWRGRWPRRSGRRTSASRSGRSAGSCSSPSTATVPPTPAPCRSPTGASRSAGCCSPATADAAPGSAPPTSGCSPTSCARPPPRPGPGSSPPSSSAAASGWSPPSRTSAAGSAATCTTGSGPPSPRSPPGSTPPGSPPPGRPRSPTGCSRWPATRSAACSPSCAAWCTGCGPGARRRGARPRDRPADRAAPRPGLTVRVEAPDDLGALPAAVEVAAYRIVSEALTNVVRHARATHCTVRIARDPARPCLVVEVLDDGVGIAPGTSAGVGLVSLRERAAELGGRCEVTAGDPAGTKVHAELPLAPTLTEPALTGAGTEGGLA